MNTIIFRTIAPFLAALAGLFLQAGFFGFIYAAMATGASAAAAACPRWR